MSCVIQLSSTKRFLNPIDFSFVERVKAFTSSKKRNLLLGGWPNCTRCVVQSEIMVQRKIVLVNESILCYIDGNNRQLLTTGFNCIINGSLSALCSICIAISMLSYTVLSELFELTASGLKIKQLKGVQQRKQCLRKLRHIHELLRLWQTLMIG